MGAPIIFLPSERLAHGLGVPIEHLKMGFDVAGLADSMDLAPTGSALIPPEEMLHEDWGLRNQEEWSGRVEGNVDFLPPEMGMAPIPRLVAAQPLIPGEKVTHRAPITEEVMPLQITDARNEMIDTYPASEGGNMNLADALDIGEQDVSLMGEDPGVLDVFVKGAEGFVKGLTERERAAQAAQLEMQRLAALAEAERRKVWLAVGIGAVVLGGFLYWRYSK